MIKILRPLLPQSRLGAIRYKHAYASLLIEQAGVHQQIDALVGGGGVDLVGSRVFRDGRHLAALWVGPGEDAGFQLFRQLEENGLFTLERHGVTSLAHRLITLLTNRKTNILQRNNFVNREFTLTSRER